MLMLLDGLIVVSDLLEDLELKCKEYVMRL